MSGREWKPGDVAMVTWDNASLAAKQAGESDIKTSVALFDHDGGWTFPHDGCSLSLRADQADCIDEVRRLVVIDPEDRDQVERLAEALTGIAWDGVTGHLQIVLRAFANPQVKPDEPMGLGAVVEDSKGRRHVRVEAHPKVPWNCQGVDEWQGDWSDIDAVKVLSEGVVPE